MNNEFDEKRSEFTKEFLEEKVGTGITILAWNTSTYYNLYGFVYGVVYIKKGETQRYVAIYYGLKEQTFFASENFKQEVGFFCLSTPIQKARDILDLVKKFREEKIVKRDWWNKNQYLRNKHWRRFNKHNEWDISSKPYPIGRLLKMTEHFDTFTIGRRRKNDSTE